VTPSVTAQGDTNLSDVTEWLHEKTSAKCVELDVKPQICINILQIPYLLFTPYHIM